MDDVVRLDKNKIRDEFWLALWNIGGFMCKELEMLELRNKWIDKVVSEMKKKGKGLKTEEIHYLVIYFAHRANICLSGSSVN